MKRTFTTRQNHENGYVFPFVLILLHLLFLMAFFQMSQYQYTQRATENDLIQYQFHSLYQMGKQSLQEEKEDVNFPITYHFPNGDVKVYSQQLKFDRANYVIELNTKDGHRRTLTLHVPRNSH